MEVELKYISGKSDSDIKKYNPNPFTPKIDNNKLTVLFTELFNKDENLDKSTYYIKIYLKKDISDIKKINTVNNFITPVKTITKEGENKGLLFNVTEELSKDINDTFYFVLTTEFSFKDGNEDKVNYGMCECYFGDKKSDNFWILWLVLGILGTVLIIGGIALYFIYHKKNETPFITDSGQLTKEGFIS